MPLGAFNFETLKEPQNSIALEVDVRIGHPVLVTDVQMDFICPASRHRDLKCAPEKIKVMDGLFIYASANTESPLSHCFGSPVCLSCNGAVWTSCLVTCSHTRTIEVPSF